MTLGIEDRTVTARGVVTDIHCCAAAAARRRPAPSRADRTEPNRNVNVDVADADGGEDDGIEVFGVS